MLDRILRTIRARIVRPDRVTRLTAELFAAELERDSARRAFHAVTAECAEAVAMRDQYKANASVLLANYSAVVDELAALQGQAIPAPTPRRKPTAEERLERLKRNMVEYHAREYGVFHDIREALRHTGTPMSARDICDYTQRAYGPSFHIGNMQREVSDYARCGYLTVTKVKGVAHYSLPVAVGHVDEAVLTNCLTCAVCPSDPDDEGICDKAANDATVGRWSNVNVEDGRPKPGSHSCPGYVKRGAA